MGRNGGQLAINDYSANIRWQTSAPFVEGPPHDQSPSSVALDIRESSARRISVVKELIAFQVDLAISVKRLLRRRNSRIEATVVKDDEVDGTTCTVRASPRPSDRLQVGDGCCGGTVAQPV